MRVVSDRYTQVLKRGDALVEIPPGQAYELPDEAAREAISRGLVREATAAPVADRSVDAASSPASESDDDLVAAIIGLDAENGEHFTSAGIPRVEALSAALGRPVTSAERDAAWARYQAEVAE